MDLEWNIKNTKKVRYASTKWRKSLVWMNSTKNISSYRTKKWKYMTVDNETWTFLFTELAWNVENKGFSTKSIYIYIHTYIHQAGFLFSYLSKETTTIGQLHYDPASTIIYGLINDKEIMRAAPILPTTSLDQFVASNFTLLRDDQSMIEEEHCTNELLLNERICFSVCLCVHICHRFTI